MKSFSKYSLGKALAMLEATESDFSDYQRVCLIFQRARQIVLQQRTDFLDELDEVGTLPNDQLQLVGVPGGRSDIAIKFERKTKPLIKSIAGFCAADLKISKKKGPSVQH